MFFVGGVCLLLQAEMRAAVFLAMEEQDKLEVTVQAAVGYNKASYGDSKLCLLWVSFRIKVL